MLPRRSALGRAEGPAYQLSPLPGTALVHQLFAALEAEGLADAGTQSLVQALEKLANAQIG